MKVLSVRVLETKTIQSSVVFPDSDQWPLSSDRIELPRAALIDNSEGGLVRIVFAAFDRLESILKPSYDHFDLKSSRSYVRNTAVLSNDSDVNAGEIQQRLRILNSKVISASLGKGRHIQLSQPITLTLKHLKTENVTNPTCVFGNYIDHAWSANGCSLESTNRTHSVCSCNHLTNFAILMDVVDEHQHSLFTMFDGNMRIFIYISIGICVVFIVIALLTLKLFNGVFVKSARTSIYTSIYLCLLAIELLFLLGIEQTETSIFCGFITIFLHCAILSGTAWFCYEAFHSYSTLTSDELLLEVDQTPKVNCYYLLSYGLSLSVVAISLVIDPSTYTQNDYCVLMEANALFYATFVVPVLVFFAAAIGYTFLSWIIIFDIRCSFVFLLLLSAVWCSAYFYLRGAKMDDDTADVYGYCFICFNTLLGLYIFVFHCIQNEKIRREYRKYVRQHAWLPKCLRCSKTSISSGIVTGNGPTAGTLCSVSTSKKPKLPLGSARTSIYTSIYLCLLAIELLFLLGIEQTETSIFCGFITIFLHCAILSGTAWFCYEAFHSYSTLTSDELLLEVDQTPKVNCYYLLSYGLSLSVVAISLVIDPSTYTQNDYCVLMEANALFYATFVVPVLVFFVAAIGYTFLSWIIMCRKSRTGLKTKEHTRLASVRNPNPHPHQLTHPHPHQHPPHHQQRHLSAMLDENNTVRCYLEPLAK
ncbi:GD10581 [Drosophila simulans]|uniref:Latrophilin Cirl n=1 Tax=Drosophila simulans TaxID=7240 RepID=B4QG59_DROSI|nr:GD10581 [Drosophila simulans]